VLNITDGAFVGHGVGSIGLASINIAAPLFMLISGIGLTFGIGGSVVASIHLSRGSVKAANINITQSLIGAEVLGILLSAIICLFPEPTCRLFGASDALMPTTWSYMRWLVWGLPLYIPAYVVPFIVRLDGRPRVAMLLHLVLAAMNIFLDWLLIFPLNMGLEGAAIATTSSSVFVAAVSIWFLLARPRTLMLYRLRLTGKSLRLTLRNLGYQIRMGGSTMVGEMSLALLMIIGNYVFIKYLGEDGVAAFSVGCYCTPICFMLGNAIVESVQPIISYAHGVGNVGRLRESLRVALVAAVSSGLLGMGFMMLGDKWICQVFLDPDCRAYELCVAGLPWFSLAFFFVSVNITLVGIYQSLEQAGKAVAVTLLRGLVLLLPSFLILPQILGIPGIWLSLPMAEALTMVCGIILLFITARKWRANNSLS